ncbi:MAG: bifunctional folylpolyglutamate synthase/dihydrofolate synthase [Candidatus Dormibacteraeota bacterium]|uniref:tetrahydrofolate synthase n=1 Tax=Candidatus Amunia macphersoniae TaxID=3127014 RepID=A0A934KPE6_9BACT|nr:bifunctional folylpolyglutamate synthase/dihydrofolate synthase [Candidatus Dormibacteraeota bacterium]
MALAVTAYERATAALGALEGRGMKLGLERIEALLTQLGNPHAGLVGVLVAGTNGKGSVCALLDAVATTAGLSTVMMTKPHLVSWRERIAVDGAPIAEDDFAGLIFGVLDAAAAIPGELGSPTVTEVVTAAGIVAAREHAPDLLITEVGLGGRLDSTNVLDLGVAVVTGIAIDHRAELGDDIAGIAAEKAAIIKPGNDVVTGATGVALDVIRDAAERAGAASLAAVGTDIPWRGEDLGREGVGVEIGAPVMRVRTPLIGRFQERNLAVAAQVCRVLERRGMATSDDAIRRGAAAVRWPGRMQWLDGTPPLLVDGCHNPEAVAAMVTAALPLCAGRRTVIVFGAMADKDLDGMMAALRPLSGEVVFTRPSTVRGAQPGVLAAQWGGGALTAADVPAALLAARRLAGEQGVVVACGSLYIAGEALAAAGVTTTGGLAAQL